MPRVLIFAALLLIATCANARAYLSNQPEIFGSYSQAYKDRWQLKKWRAMCKTGARYQAMSEAYNVGKPDPCNAVVKQ